MNFPYLNPGKSAKFTDRHVKKVAELFTPYQAGSEGEIGVIGLPSSRSSITMSMASDAPVVIRECFQSFTTYSHDQQQQYNSTRFIDFGDVTIHPTSVEETLQRLYVSVKGMLSVNSCPKYLMLGGDHGVSFPSIRAFSEKFGRIGVIQWDAHHDVRNLEDGGRTNGTPFRSLIEGGHIRGEDLIQIGIRDFSNAKAYDEYCSEQGITIHSMNDVDERGIRSIIEEALTELQDRVDMIYLSVDMDVVDQAFAPGCPAIGPGGITSRELLSSVKLASAHPKVKAMDIVEIDPSQDFRKMTSRLAANTVLQYAFR
ncbi:formimidoylglutamase [Bacillus sp. 2205SS5-2]|uniref:formimidoylglutamase n=1 Tax=Bacillus sp. 2205SS5-2 TaxID=3109031 RepID=UPI003005DD10